MASLKITCHALALTYLLWMYLNSKCVYHHCYIFHVFWFSQLCCSRTMPSPTWVDQCTSGYIGSITSREKTHAPLGVGVVFACMHVFILLCMFFFACLFSYLIFLCIYLCFCFVLCLFTCLCSYDSFT